VIFSITSLETPTNLPPPQELLHCSVSLAQLDHSDQTISLDDFKKTSTHSRSITHSRVSSHFPGQEREPMSAPRHLRCRLVTPSPHDAEQGSQLDQLAQPAVSTHASFIAAATLLAVF